MSPQANHSPNALTSTVLAEIKQAFKGQVPNLFQAYAKYPPLLEANWDKFKAIMLNGKLRRKVKEAIALLISHDNKCRYCVVAHSAALRSMDFDEEAIAGMLQSMLPTDFSQKEMALIKFARKANDEWHKISEASIKELFALGVDEAELLEALGVMEMFVAFNRFADVMGIEIDF